MKPNEIAPKRQFAKAATRPRRDGVALNNAVKRRAARETHDPVFLRVKTSCRDVRSGAADRSHPRRNRARHRQCVEAWRM